MIFTDENGEKFEVVTSNLALTNGYLIAPVKPEPKWKVRLIQNDLIGDKIDIQLDTTTPQAQLIKEAVEALMVAITENPKYVFREGPFYAAINKARKGLQT